MTDFYALNYNMKKQAFVSPQEILNLSKGLKLIIYWRKILKMKEVVLRKSRL